MIAFVALTRTFFFCFVLFNSCFFLTFSRRLPCFWNLEYCAMNARLAHHPHNKIISPEFLLIEASAGQNHVARATVTVRNAGSTVLFLTWSRVPRPEAVTAGTDQSTGGVRNGNGRQHKSAVSTLVSPGEKGGAPGGSAAKGPAASRGVAQEPDARFFCHQVGNSIGRPVARTQSRRATYHVGTWCIQILQGMAIRRLDHIRFLSTGERYFSPLIRWPTSAFISCPARCNCRDGTRRARRCFPGKNTLPAFLLKALTLASSAIVGGLQPFPKPPWSALHHYRHDHRLRTRAGSSSMRSCLHPTPGAKKTASPRVLGVEVHGATRRAVTRRIEAMFSTLWLPWGGRRWVKSP